LEEEDVFQSSDPVLFMSRKKKLRARPQSLGKRLTLKQAAFLRHYTDPLSDGCGNATRASELAGYKGAPSSNQLSVQGCRNLRHPDIQEEISTELKKQGFTQQFAAKLLMSAMRATKVQVVPNRRGKPAPCKFPDHHIRMQGFDRAMRFSERNKPSPNDVEPWMVEVTNDAIARGVLRPLGRRNLSDDEKKVLAEYESFSPADRMLMCRGYEAFARYLELGGNGAELLKGLGIASSDAPKPEADSATGHSPAPGPGHH
jgi:hypothetical protein